ncbi:class I SAM-dependent methyltransferase [Streptomyces griseorubiginosus]|uniref:class I SAM-dependent methyltransferase n=1 Tax=Streptomyces griseorubiginosus TaxID=67304 RepID=UPI0033A93AD9
MPTSPREHRAVAESYGSDAERYDRTRPRYPDALLERIVAHSPGPHVLDVGTGTGIAGLALRSRGCRVLGVEPDARMAAFARRKGLDVEVARFEEWDPAGRVFDAVVAGTVWHWVDPVAGAVQAGRVLRPGGRLALFWNAFQPAPGVADLFTEVYARALSGLPSDWRRMDWRRMTGPDAYAGVCATAAQGIREASVFAEPEEWRFGWDRVYTREEWLDQVPTFGGHGQLPAEQLDALLTGLGEAVDALGGSFTMHYTAVAVTAVRNG